jgi:hypothetical protein
MATVSTFPKQETFETTILRLTNDLLLFRLPDGAADIFVESSENYFVRFEDRNVFGVSIAPLKRGHNVFTALNRQETAAYVFTESTVSGSLNPTDAATGPIKVPPRGGPIPGPNPHVASKKPTGTRRR